MSMSEKSWLSFNRAKLIDKELVNVSESGEIMLYLSYDAIDRKYWVCGQWSGGSFSDDPYYFYSKEEAEKYFNNLFQSWYNPDTDDARRACLGYSTED